jgi:hypothetical protein
MPRSKAEVEPTNKGSSRCAAAGRGTGVDCRSASLLVYGFSSSCSLEGDSRDAFSNFLGGGFDTKSDSGISFAAALLMFPSSAESDGR